MKSAMLWILTFGMICIGHRGLGRGVTGDWEQLNEA